MANDSPWSCKDTASLAGKHLGLIKDYSCDSGDFDKWASAAPLVEWTAGDDALGANISKLAAGHLDAILDDSNVLSYRIRQMGGEGRLKAGGVLSGSGESQQLYIAFSPKNPSSERCAKILSEGIRQMRASGRLKALLDSCGLKDWK